MPLNTGGEQTAFYNDGGVGHGGFVAAFAVAGQVILEPFNRKLPSKTIMQGNQIGAPLKQASISDFETATATAQIPVDSTGNNPTFIQKGDSFIAPTNFGGDKWYVDDVSETYAAGQFWKSELSLRKSYNV
jgi:hypothetical protein